jgi:hypothetical protein
MIFSFIILAYRWSIDNDGLLLNGKKTQALRLNGDLVVYTNKFRNLGMIVNNRLFSGSGQ